LPGIQAVPLPVTSIIIKKNLKKKTSGISDDVHKQFQDVIQEMASASDPKLAICSEDAQFHLNTNL